ncbi:MAG: patatin-like phospholipase family protein [Actinobacteria bacterium]|nr:patatin-like phospholipase family protein [Actinomycetota bacterium]
MGDVTILHLPWARHQPPRTVFVLGGGGNLGAIQVGMLRAVLEQGITPDEVVGCSVGAINAAAIAADPTPNGVKRLQDIWHSIDGGVICPSGPLSSIRLLTRRARSMQPNDGLRDLIVRWLPFTTFDEAPIPFHVVATSLTTGHARWFASGPVMDPLLASAALPAIFPPVEIDGELYTDGAVVDNVPISKAIELGARRVYVFHVGNFERAKPAPRRPVDVLLQSFSIARNNRFLREVAQTYEGVEITVLPSIDPGSIRYDDFRHSRQLAERAYASTVAYLDAPRHQIAAGS